jgi:DNA polymerase-1
MVTKSGQVVNAVYGFTSFLLKAIEEFRPSHVVLTLDRKEPTFRHKEYKEYKATRVKAPDELYTQIPLVKKVVESFGIPIYELAGYEADDLIGTITKKVTDDIKKIIITGDMDTLQLVDEQTFVYSMSRGLSDSVIYDIAGVKNRFNLRPDQMIDYKGLRGDPSDNIPGVRGIGEKTAEELLTNFKNLDGVYKAVENNDPKIKPRIIELLKTYHDDAYLSKKLATIERNAPIDFNLEATAFDKIDKTEIIKIFSELEFRSLIPRLNNLENNLEKTDTKNSKNKNTVETIKTEDKFERDLKSFKYHLVDDDKKFAEFLEKLTNQKIFTFDTETTDLDPLTCDLLGISFSWKEGEAYYLKIITKSQKKTAPAGLFGDLEPPNQGGNTGWLRKLEPIFKNKDIKKCGHNLKFDTRILQNKGLEVNGLYFDTMIASYLLNPDNRQHNLDAVVFNQLSFEKINHEELLGSGKNKINFADTPIEKMFVYSCEDADFTNRLVEILNKKIKTEKLTKVFFEIEMPLIPVLCSMENNGILIDQEVLKEMKHDLNLELKKLEKKIYEQAGTEFNIASPKQLKEILFEKLQIETKGIKKTKTGLSTAADELIKMKDAHPIIPLIQNFRELSKLQNTYVEALPELINPQTGRLHTSFNQTIAATGRLSSNEPNLQNIPTRTEMGKKIRTAFVAPEGYTFASLDYSQIELRLIADMASDKRMITAFLADEDIHRATAAAINAVKLAEVTPKMRQEAKAINFGIIYGQGPHGLSEGAGIPYAKAQEFIAKYFEIYAGVKSFIANNIATAKTQGYVETMFGRRRYVPEINSKMVMMQKAAERVATNTPLQGTAADIIKLAMIKINDLVQEKNDIKMILQIHDELIFEIKKDKVDHYTKEIKKIMEEVVKLKVPLRADLNLGKNWGELK